MRLSWLVGLTFAVAALLGGGTGSGASTPVCSASGPRVCVDLVGTPSTVAPSGDTDHYVNYVAHIAIEGNQSATHTGANLDLSGGLVLDSVTSRARVTTRTSAPSRAAASAAEQPAIPVPSTRTSVDVRGVIA